MGLLGSFFGCSEGNSDSQAPRSPEPHFKLFFADYSENKIVESKDARIATKSEILRSMNSVLHMPRNFIGVIDKDETTLQFMVNDDKTIHVDVPAPTRTGSFVKTAELRECLGLVSNLGSTIDVARIDGLVFKSWNAE